MMVSVAALIDADAANGDAVMSEQKKIPNYNYDNFVGENYWPMMRFDESPPVGEKAPDFKLWRVDGTETSLSEQWKANLLTVVEFGSYT